MLQAWLAVLRSFPKRKRPRRDLTELIFDDTPAEAVAVLRALAGHKLRDTWLGWRMLFDLSLVRTAESTLQRWEIDESAEHSFNSATSVLLGGTKDGEAFFGAHWNDDGIVFFPAELAALVDTMARHDLQTSSLCWRSLHTDLSISGTAEGILEAAEIDESAEGWFDERKSLMLGDSAGGEVYFGIHWDGGAPRFFEIDFEWQAYAVAPITTYRSAEALTIPHRREPNPAAGPEDRHFESIAGQFPGKGARVSRGLPCESLA